MFTGMENDYSSSIMGFAPLEYRIFYKNKEDSIKMTSRQIAIGSGETPEKFLNKLLKLTTEFVQNNWVRVEVTTPMTSNFGRLEGGHKVFNATRE
jgi:hypothetical protein